MATTTVFLAQRNSDMTEGRGPMVTIAAFTTEKDATLAAKGQGVMGVGDGEVRSLKVYGSFSEYLTDKNDALRVQALKKLTPEEKRALGL